MFGPSLPIKLSPDRAAT